ncbi:hypothetical protein KAZ57_01470 [Patescibacteria group bacterium]|nr:hypothetical protein [Patescibacteria group bacterium]
MDTAAKSTIEDVVELASGISDSLINAEASVSLPYEIVFEYGERGWQLRLAGGDRLMRQLFIATCEATKRDYDFTSTVLFDKQGIVILDLSSGKEDVALRFAERMAKIFKTELLM